MDTFIEVIRSDGTTALHRSSGAQVTIGRSPSAGVALVNAIDLLPEHLMVAPRSDGCWVAVAAGAQPAAFIMGQSFTHGLVPWGTEIAVGSVKLRVLDRAPRRGKRRSPLLIGVLLAALAVLAIVLVRSGQSEDAGPPPEAPALFDAAEPCSRAGIEASALARESANAASQRADRYPFDPQEGIEAVRLYGIAAACVRAGGQADLVPSLERQREVLSARVNEDYRGHRLRLERALVDGYYALALRQIRLLQAMLRHRRADPYYEWLDALAREIELSGYSE